jgi:hypothetical protein
VAVAGAARPGSLEALMRQAAGVTPASIPAPTPKSSGPPGQGESVGGEGAAAASVPLRPSLGAVSGAIGMALPSARACVDADAPLSRAKITFRSDGSVAEVEVSGWAAGRPAEACIRAALMRTRVPPFAEPTYVVPATIRSN